MTPPTDRSQMSVPVDAVQTPDNTVFFLREYQSRTFSIYKHTWDRLNRLQITAFKYSLLYNVPQSSTQFTQSTQSNRVEPSNQSRLLRQAKPSQHNPQPHSSLLPLSEQDTFSRVVIKITTRSFIGLIKIDDNFNLVITPKIGHADFLAMLQYVDPDRVQSWEDLLTGIHQHQNFVELFIQHFLDETQTLLTDKSRKGYSLHHENRLQPKGHISLRRTINNSYKFPPHTACQYYQFDLDTPHNQVIKYTLIYLKPIIPKQKLRQYRGLLKKLTGVKYRRWSGSEIQNLPYSRLNTPYQPIHRMCILILEDFSLLFQPGQASFFSFIINSWNIYERFLLRIFQLFQSEYEVKAYYSSKQEKAFSDSDLYPDIVLLQDGQPQVILDAKYKPISSSRHDIDQLNRYLGDEGLQIGFLIYPSYDPFPSGQVCSVEEHPYFQHSLPMCIFTIQMDLKICANEENLQEFVQEILELFEIKKKTI